MFIAADQGVVIIANGSPIYGAMALNLAVSIKCNDPFAKIALIYTDSAIPSLSEGRNQQLYQKWIDYLIECPSNLLKWGVDTNHYIWPRLYIYELSPFKRTLYLDADSIIMRSKRASQLLDSVKGREYAVQYSERYPIDSEGGWWVKCADLLSAYGRCSEHVYEVNGFVSYFARSEDNEAYFALAREIVSNPKTSCLSFRGAIGDETAQVTATFIMDRRPTEPRFAPILWQGLLNKGVPLSSSDYWAYTFTHSDPQNACDNYCELVSEYARPRSLRLDASPLAEPKKEPFGEWIKFSQTPIPAPPEIEIASPPPNQSFPKHVHQIWINNESENVVPERYIPLVNSWITRSGLTHHLYSNADLRRFLTENYPQFLDFYDLATYETEKSDICRYLLLHKYGGIYANADMMCLRPMGPLLEAVKAPVCMALKPPTHRFWGRRLLGSAFVLSQPDQPMWLEVVEFMQAHYRPRSYPAITTGAYIIDYFLHEHGHKSDIEVIDSHYIFPVNLNQRVQIETSEPFCEHVWTGVDSWVPKIPFTLRQTIQTQTFNIWDEVLNLVNHALDSGEADV